MQLKAVCQELPAPIHGKVVTLVDDKGYSYARIQTGVSMCCGMNALFNFNLSLLSSAQRVEEFFDELVKQPWKHPSRTGPMPHYDMKHYIFTCGMGLYCEDGPHYREDSYRFLINDPRVKLINRSPSISEPGEGHDIGIFFVDLT